MQAQWLLIDTVEGVPHSPFFDGSYGDPLILFHVHGLFSGWCSCMHLCLSLSDGSPIDSQVFVYVSQFPTLSPRHIIHITSYVCDRKNILTLGLDVGTRLGAWRIDPHTPTSRYVSKHA